MHIADGAVETEATHSPFARRSGPFAAPVCHAIAGMLRAAADMFFNASPGSPAPPVAPPGASSRRADADPGSPASRDSRNAGTFALGVAAHAPRKKETQET